MTDRSHRLVQDLMERNDGYNHYRVHHVSIFPSERLCVELNVVK